MLLRTQSGSVTAPTAPQSENWSVHGQTTLTHQYAFPFRAPNRGPNSLDSGAGRETWDATFYVGWRLWQGAEIWINPEIDQGFGLSTTLGVAGFPSAEAYKLVRIIPIPACRACSCGRQLGLAMKPKKLSRSQPVRRVPIQGSSCRHGRKVLRNRCL
jgi:hypothetical protein